MLLAHIKTYEDLDSSITHQQFRNSNFINQHAVNLKQSDHCHQNTVLNLETCINIQNQLKPQKFMCQTIYATSMNKTHVYMLLPLAQPTYTCKDFESQTVPTSNVLNIYCQLMKLYTGRQHKTLLLIYTINQISTSLCIQIYIHI